MAPASEASRASRCRSSWSRRKAAPPGAHGVAAVVLALVVVPALAAEGGTVLRSDISVQPSALAAPATLAATTTGTTTLGLSATSAATSYTPAGLPRDVLKVLGDGHDWGVRLEILSMTGGGALDSVTLRLCDPPASCLTQVTVSGTSITMATGLPVTLETGETDITVQSTATKVSLGAIVLDLQLVFTPPGGSVPEFRYGYTLTMP